MNAPIFHPDFKPRPFWWEATAGEVEPMQDLPACTDVLIVGAGLTGLNCAIELARGGADAVAVDAESVGFGASTRNGALLHQKMLDRWPQLKGVRITHAWTGNVVFAFDYLPHMGQTDKGLHYAMACNGSGVAVLSCLGAETGKKLLGKSNRAVVFDGHEFPTRPGYTGTPWMLPVVGNWHRFRDWLDRRVA